jgi:hypothetical protein
VLATPQVRALAKRATVATVAGALQAGTTTVGVRVELDHLAFSPVGAELEVEAVLERVAGRRLVFAVHDGQAVAPAAAVRVTVPMTPSGGHHTWPPLHRPGRDRYHRSGRRAGNGLGARRCRRPTGPEGSCAGHKATSPDQGPLSFPGAPSPLPVLQEAGSGRSGTRRSRCAEQVKRRGRDGRIYDNCQPRQRIAPRVAHHPSPPTGADSLQNRSEVP